MSQQLPPEKNRTKKSAVFCVQTVLTFFFPLKKKTEEARVCCGLCLCPAEECELCSYILFLSRREYLPPLCSQKQTHFSPLSRKKRGGRKKIIRPSISLGHLSLGAFKNRDQRRLLSNTPSLIYVSNTSLYI